MSRIEPDSLMQRHLSPEPGEAVQAEFRADAATYWKGHLVMVVILGTLAGLVLVVMGNPWPVMGPIGAACAIAGRGAFLASEALSDRWVLTERRLLGPAARSIPLGQIVQARPFLGAVQIVTRGGDKHLIKYLADGAGVARQINAASGITA